MVMPQGIQSMNQKSSQNIACPNIQMFRKIDCEFTESPKKQQGPSQRKTVIKEREKAKTGTLLTIGGYIL